MEDLGAAASVIAVASLALQLVESVKHLCTFWQSISDAPESIRDIAKELHVLSTILANIANTALPERQNENMKLVLETCASQIETLHSITRHLKEQFSSTSKAKRREEVNNLQAATKTSKAVPSQKYTPGAT